MERMRLKWWFEMVELLYDLLLDMRELKPMVMTSFFKLDRLLEVFLYKDKIYKYALTLFQTDDFFDEKSTGMRLRSRQL